MASENWKSQELEIPLDLSSTEIKIRLRRQNMVGLTLNYYNILITRAFSEDPGKINKTKLEEFFNLAQEAATVLQDGIEEMNQL